MKILGRSLILLVPLFLAGCTNKAKAKDRPDEGKFSKEQPKQTIQNTNAANPNSTMGVRLNSLTLGRSATRNHPPYNSQSIVPGQRNAGCFLQGYGCLKVNLVSGFPVVNGVGLAQQEVHAVSNANLHHIQNCYDQFLRRAPSATGTLGATFVIAPNGRVNSVKAGVDTLYDGMMSSCVTRKIQSWDFPRPRGNSSSTVDIKFSFGAEPPSVFAFNDQQVQVLIGGIVSPQYFVRETALKRYVEAKEGKEYSIRISNPFGVRVAVAVAVDGLNSIDASHATAGQSKKWIIAPYQSITVSGWQVASDRLRKFVFAREESSYGAKLGKTNDLGNISIALFRERTPPSTLLLGGSDGLNPSLGLGAGKSMNKLSDGSGNSFGSGTGGLLSGQAGTGGTGQAANLGTSFGFGRSVGGAGSGARANPVEPPSAKSSSRYAATAMGNSQQNNISFVKIDLERTPVVEVSIRYEYREVLEKMGILPVQALSSEDTLHRRERGQGFQKVTYSPEVQ